MKVCLLRSHESFVSLQGFFTGLVAAMRDAVKGGIDAARRRAGARAKRLGRKTGSRRAERRRPAAPFASAPSTSPMRFSIRRQGTVRCGNAACRRYFKPGSGRDGALAPISALSPKEALAYERLLDRVLSTGEQGRLDVRLSGVADQDGRAIDLAIELHPERNAAGRVEGVIGVARDVSALRRAIAATEMKAREFESLFEVTPDIVVRYDVDLRRIYCNSAAERALATPSKLLGKPHRRGRGRRQPARIRATLESLSQTRRPQKFEITLRDVAGEPTHHYILMAPEFDPSGAASGVLAIGRDFSDL